MPLDGDAAGAFGRVPTELREWRQWVCWKYGAAPSGKPTKLPIQARNGQLADPTDPDHWNTFEAAVASVDLWGANGIGFVFGPDDPYAGIDLDVSEDGANDALKAAHESVLAAFPSYTEVSPSGRGLHIIVRGTIQGARKAGVEAYSTGRFFTMTGNVHRDLPLITADRENLAELQAILAPNRLTLGALSTVPETVPDQVIVERMAAAKNGSKAMALMAGDASALGSSDRSGSAIDIALVNCIAYQTQCVPQIERIWLGGEHGQNERRRKKLERFGYRMGTIRRALDRAVPPIDLTALKAEWAAKRTGAASDTAPVEFKEETNMPTAQAATPSGSAQIVPFVNRAAAPPPDITGLQAFAHGRDPHTPPDGTLGELAKFILHTAHRQVHEIALAGAVGWMAGVCGGAYNVNGAGLNLYIAMLAESGVGKSAVKNAFGLIRSAMLADYVDKFGQFYGPGDFASGPGLMRVLAAQRSFVSVIGEFGVWLEEMGGVKPNPVRQSLRRALLDLYLCSGANGTYEGTANAKLEHSTVLIEQPCVSLIGETTPDVFYDAMSDNQIKDGFLARFIIFEYIGAIPYANENKMTALPADLRRDLQRLSLLATAHLASKGSLNVGVPPNIALQMAALDRFCVDRANSAPSKSIAAVWNRVVGNIWKIAALVAIGAKYYEPVIDDTALHWAIAYVAHSSGKLIGKLDSGEVAGSLSEKQYAELMRVLREFPNMEASSLASYRLKPANIAHNICNATFLNRRLCALPVFRASGVHVNAALKAALARAIEEDTLRLLPKGTVEVESNHLSGTCYAINKDAF